MTYTRATMTTALRNVRCPLLIGRDDLLELVDRRLDDVATGHGHFLLIAGEAGIGKTRFLAAIRNKVEARGIATATGSVAPQDRDVPAASILDMARSMTEAVPFASLGRQLLDLRDATLAAEHVQRRRLVMDVVERIVESLPSPAMLSFEDLQWTDDLSLEIIAELARRTRDRPLLLTANYRTEDAPPGTSLREWRARLITQRVAEEVRLAPFTQPETALATTLILATGLPAPRDVATAVFERTDGIPLHIEELLGALSDVARADGMAIREATVPDTIEDAVIARLALRSPEAQAVARAGAVIGRCFVPGVLAGIMDLPPDALEGPLQELVDHFVLSAPWSAGGYYDFRHQLLRDALYRTIPAAERRRYHARAGEFGAQLDGASEIHASVHYERAGLRRQAFEAAVAGARDAARLSAHREAFELYRRAVANAPADLGPSERGGLLEAHADQAAAIEHLDASERIFREARSFYLAAGRPDKAATMLVRVLTVWRRDTRSTAARSNLAAAVLLELQALPVDTERDAAQAELLSELVQIHLEARDLVAARSALQEMAAMATRRSDLNAAFAADAFASTLDFLAGQVAVGLDGVTAVAYGARSAGADDAGVGAFRDGVTLAVQAMDYPRAARMLADGMSYAESIEANHCGHVMGATLSLVQWAGGRWEDAIPAARQHIADGGCRRALTTAHWALGYVAFGQGDLETAHLELSAALAVGEENGSVQLILPPLWGLAETAFLASDRDLATERCDRALALARAVGERALLAPFVVTGVRAAQAAGRPADAEVWLAACVEHLSAMPAVTKPALDHGRGLVALAAGATGIAAKALQAAVQGWDDRRRVWEATWVRLDLASCLTRSNRFAEAVALAVEVRAVASRLDSRPLADRADALVRMARGHVAVEEPWRPLTAREFAVARLITEGLTNGEIAASLGIAPKTASSHVEHILAKLGASRRAEIAAWASHVERSPAPH